MQHLKLVLIVLLLICADLSDIKAQESTLSSGGDASGSGGSVSYSIGQVVYTTNAGTTGSMAQGVQQAYEISVVTGINDIKGVSLKCTAYPNPTTDFLTLKIENYFNNYLSYQLFDMSGRLLEIKTIEASETTIEMSNFVSATYFLHITNNKLKVKTFKIIKN